MSSIAVISVVVLIPILWQIPRTFWPVRLNPTGTRFTGLYGRYSVDSFTGYVSDVQDWTDKMTVGSVSASTSGTVIGNSVMASTTVHDGRRTFSTFHDGFFLTDEAGRTRTIDAANVSPVVGEGHLVSAAWLVHNGKSGNAFLVYNHTTDQVWIEQTRSGMRNAPRGLIRMILPLPTIYVVVLTVLIVTFPLVFAFGLGVQWQSRRFRKHGARPLIDALQRRAAGMPPRRAQASAAVPAQAQPAVIDLAAQVKEITLLHDSGALTDDEYQAAKTKLLST
jgi:hypothetical protein